jgi:hypothetical protein
MKKSSYEMKQAIDAQGHYFMARRILSRWEVYGFQQHDTAESATAEGERAKVNGECEGFEVIKVTL